MFAAPLLLCHMGVSVHRNVKTPSPSQKTITLNGVCVHLNACIPSKARVNAQTNQGILCVQGVAKVYTRVLCCFIPSREFSVGMVCRRKIDHIHISSTIAIQVQVKKCTYS